MMKAAFRTGRVLVLASLLACEHSAPPTTSDASDVDVLIQPQSFKVAFLASDPTTPLRVYHHRTNNIDKLPWAYSGLLAVTYDGERFVATDNPPPDYVCNVVVLDSHATLLRRQIVSTSRPGQSCTADLRSPDGAKVVVNGTKVIDGGYAPFLGTLDADGWYHELAPIGYFARYAPDGRTLIFYQPDDQATETMFDDATNRTQVTSSGSDAAFSFDQKRVTFVSVCGAGWWCIHVMDLQTHTVDPCGPQVWSTRVQPRFVPDGRSIVFTDTKQHVNGVYSLKRLSLDTCQIDTLLDDMGAHGFSPPFIAVAEDHDSPQ